MWYSSAKGGAFMANFVPKEKKPTLNRERIQMDLKESKKQPPLLRFALIVLFVVMCAIWFGLLYGLLTANVLPAVLVLYWVLFVFYSCLPALLLFIIWLMTEDELRARLGKFDIRNDTIERKVFREPVRVYNRRTSYDRRKYRYPSVIYFKKFGRYEINYNTESYFGEYDGRAEARNARRLDEFELEKKYIVVTFGKKRPRVVAVYDPDDYEVQL